MATYKEIFGKTIKFLAADPPAAIGEGQIWYNEATNSFKSSVLTAAWASSPVYTTGRHSFGSAGTQTANVIWSGYSTTMTNLTEEYNGASWTAGGVIGTSGYGARGFGTQTAAVSAGFFTPGGQQTNVYEYNGASWTAGTGLPAGRMSVGTAGILTAGLVFGGSSGPGAVHTTDTGFEYDGSSWTVAGALSTSGRTYLGGFGTQTAGAGCGGYSGSPAPATTVDTTEEYNGASWAAGGALPAVIARLSTSGIQTAGLSFGGSAGPGAVATTNSYDGSSWTTSPASLAGATWNGGGSPAGTSTVALSTAGGNPHPAATEEFTVAVAVKTITTS